MRGSIRRAVAALLAVSALTLSVTVPSAAAVSIVDLSTAGACRVSLVVHWEPFGMPYPCYPSGTSYQLTTPDQASGIRVRLNGTVVGESNGGVIALPTPLIGLNVIDYIDADGNEVGTSLRFINYVQRLRLFSFSAVTAKTPYAVSITQEEDAQALFDALGVLNTEWRAQTMSSAGGDLAYVVDLDETQVAELRGMASVRDVVQERILNVSAEQTNPPWGLDRIDQETSTLDSKYRYSRTGAGVEVFVVDSGIRTTHQEFTGRLGRGAYLSSFGSVNDCNGHGTHVAGTIGGTTYGVAKNVTIRPVRVFNCLGSSTTSAIVAAINWIISEHAETQSAVANFSLGGSLDTGLNASIEALISDGVVTIVAAGNEADDACTYSPASATNAITVAASNSDDSFASYSNYGSCVDIIAPGTGVVSAGIQTDTSTATSSGTSMATPHVAGVAALVLERDFGTYSNKRQANAFVQQTLVADSLKTVVTRSAGWHLNTPNRLLSALGFVTQGQQALALSMNETQTIAGVPLPLAATGGSGTGTVTYSLVSGDCRIQDNFVSGWTATSCVVTSEKAGSTVDTVTYTAATSAPETFTVDARVNAGEWLQVDVGKDFTCAVATNSRVYCWGSNSHGQLARPIGSVASGGSDVIDTGTASGIYPRPLLVTGLVGNVESVTTGFAHACALMQSGKVFCWGSNANGQLGDSSTVSAVSPVEAQLPETATRVSAGVESTCAVLASGAVACWGLGDDGQLGVGDTATALRPRVIQGLTGVTDISVGKRHACAIAGGTAYCWGFGGNGALGIGDTRTVMSPETITAFTSVSRISAGTESTCAVLTDADTYCWGANATGALELGHEAQAETPTVVVGLAETSTAIAVGNGATCGVNSAGLAYCMGTNTSGRLGTGNSTAYSTPQALQGLTSGVIDIAAPVEDHGCALVNGGALFCWGTNDVGQMGTGNTVPWNFMSAVTDFAIEPALVPTYDTATGTVNGFVLTMTNYDSAFTYVTSVAAETSTATLTRIVGTITVGGLLPGETATVSVTTSRVGFLTETTTTTARALYPGLLPILETVTPSADGFTVNITNFNPAYAWSAASSTAGGSATVSGSGVVTVSGIQPATTDTVTVTSSRDGYRSDSATATGTSLLAALTPTFSTVARASDGFVVTITNYDTSFAWTSTILSSTSGSPSLAASDATLTVTGLPAGASATVRVQTTRAGHGPGSANVTGTAIDPPPANSGGGGTSAVAPVMLAGGGGGGSQIVQSGQSLSVSPSSAAVALTLQSANTDDVVLTIPVSMVPDGSSVAMTSVLRSAEQPAGVFAVRVVINDPSGRRLTAFSTPLEIKLGKADTGTVVATSTDGETWTAVQRIETATLTADQRDGFKVGADGVVTVLTKHLTYFGFRLAQPSLTIAVAETLTVGTSETATFSGGAGSGAIAWSTSTPLICDVNATGQVRAIAVGTCSLAALRAGDRTYIAADATRTLLITPVPVPPVTPTTPSAAAAALRVSSIGNRRTLRITLGAARAGAVVTLQQSASRTSGYRTLATVRLDKRGAATITRTLRDGLYVRMRVGNSVISTIRLR